jgi:hypothetical protein
MPTRPAPRARTSPSSRSRTARCASWSRGPGHQPGVVARRIADRVPDAECRRRAVVANHGIAVIPAAGGAIGA